MPRNSNIQVGDLVCLSKKGERYIYGKTLCSVYYRPILEGNLGIVTSIKGNSYGKVKYVSPVRVVWFVRNGDKTTKRTTIVMSMNAKYLKRLNKR